MVARLYLFMATLLLLAVTVRLSVWLIAPAVPYLIIGFTGTGTYLLLRASRRL
ncbi:MAG: hypothetical protein AB1673_08000 [Actinomycetota bacterium]